MRYAIYTVATGEIITFMETPESMVDLQLQAGEEFYLNCPPGATHIIDNEPVTIIPEVIPPPLDEVKTAKRAELKATRDRAEQAGFTYLNKRFDSDEKSIRRLSVTVDAARTAVSLGQPFTITWTCADDSTIDLTGEQLLQIPLAMAQSGNAIHTKYRTLKKAVNDAATVEAVNAIAW